MREIVNIDFEGGGMKIISSAIDGMISDSKNLNITLITNTGGVVTFSVPNMDDFKVTEKKWADVIVSRLEALNKSSEDFAKAKEEDVSRSKAALLLQAKTLESTLNYLNK